MILNPYKRIKSLEECNQMLSKQLGEMIKNGQPKITAEMVLRGLMGRDLKYYDYHELDYAGQKNYYDTAKSILETEVFQNEFRSIMADWANYCFKESKNWEDNCGIRYSANGILAFRERLEAIENPDTPQSKITETIEGIYAPV